MSRLSRLTPESRDLYVRAISAGVPPEVAARAAGFSAASLYRYRKGLTARHAEFRRAEEQALASLEIRLAATLSKAALTEPRWALELLERRFPTRWARNRAVDILGDPGDREQAAPEAPVVFDPALVDELVPRLLEAGRRLRGQSTDDEVVDVSEFEDDGTDVEPDEPDEPQDDEDARA